MRLFVVLLQIAGVGLNLIDCGRLGYIRLLELKDNELVPGENHKVGSAATFQWQLILEGKRPIDRLRKSDAYIA
jgi:hypothetical protein